MKEQAAPLVAVHVHPTPPACLCSPPYGWIGFGWESDDRNWNDLFYLQVRRGPGIFLRKWDVGQVGNRAGTDPFYLQAGEPTGLCTEGPTGVFSRNWTLGTASLDCNSWTASLPFPSL